ncbi:unnamed protein product, partial [Laminaria digitata]
EALGQDTGRATPAGALAMVEAPSAMAPPASGVGTSALVPWTPRSVPAYDVGGGGGGGVDPARVAASMAVPRVADLPELPLDWTPTAESAALALTA